MSGITLSRLVKRYANGHLAVKGIDLVIADREFMVLVGPSGCGKSTTLRMIAGLEEVSDGEIAIGARVVNRVEPKDRDVAMVFQNYALYPHMTVFENLAYALKLRRTPAAELHARVQEAARILGLESQLGKTPKALSGGQRQRVALGRAIVRHPQAFLFDEPLSNLDAKLRGEMRVELKTLQARLATTAVYVTHDQVEAMTLGDRITVMADGEIQQVGTPLTIYDQPWNRFVAGFIGSPGMNILAGSILPGGGAFRLPDGRQLDLHMPHRQRLAAAAGDATVLALRPEHLSHGGYIPTGPTATQLPAQVVVVENMGDRQHVHLRLVGSAVPLVMACDAHHRATAGEELPLNLDTAKAQVFADVGPYAANLTLPDGFARQQ